MGGGSQVLILQASENIGADHMELGMTVFASRGGRYFHNLTGPALGHNVTARTQTSALVGVARPSPGSVIELILCEAIVSGYKKRPK